MIKRSQLIKKKSEAWKVPLFECWRPSLATARDAVFFKTGCLQRFQLCPRPNGFQQRLLSFQQLATESTCQQAGVGITSATRRFPLFYTLPKDRVEQKTVENFGLCHGLSKKRPHFFRHTKRGALFHMFSSIWVTVGRVRLVKEHANIHPFHHHGTPYIRTNTPFLP